VTVPEAWAGVWEVTLATRVCTTDSLLGVEVAVDTVCAGESVEGFLGLSGQDLEVIDCSGGFTDTHFTITCTGRSDIFCTFTATGSFEADRADSTFTGSGVVNSRLVCGTDVQEDCTETDFTGRRLAPAPATCSPAKPGLGSGVAPGARPRHHD
jgi:hypothetical protein